MPEQANGESYHTSVMPIHYYLPSMNSIKNSATAMPSSKQPTRLSVSKTMKGRCWLPKLFRVFIISYCCNFALNLSSKTKLILLYSKKYLHAIFCEMTQLSGILKLFARINCHRSQFFFDTQQLIVFGNTIGARGRAGFYLPAVERHN